MYGESYYELMAASTIATSSNDAHLLFGSYNGLSSLNQEDVVNVWGSIPANTNGGKITPKLSTSATIHITVEADNHYTNLMPMRAHDASQLHVYNKDQGANAQIEWAIWRRFK